MEKVRINRIGFLDFNGYSKYIQEVYSKHKTQENNKTEIILPVQFFNLPDTCGKRINMLV
jgi:hypothetical protein